MVFFLARGALCEFVFRTQILKHFHKSAQIDSKNMIFPCTGGILQICVPNTNFMKSNTNFLKPARLDAQNHIIPCTGGTLRICVPNTNFKTVSHIRAPRCIKPYFSLHGVDVPSLCSEHKFSQIEHTFFQARTPRCIKPYYSLHGGNFASLCSEQTQTFSHPRTSILQTTFLR